MIEVYWSHHLNEILGPLTGDGYVYINNGRFTQVYIRCESSAVCWISCCVVFLHKTGSIYVSCIGIERGRETEEAIYFETNVLTDIIVDWIPVFLLVTNYWLALLWLD